MRTSSFLALLTLVGVSAHAQEPLPSPASAPAATPTTPATPAIPAAPLAAEPTATAPTVPPPVARPSSSRITTALQPTTPAAPPVVSIGPKGFNAQSQDGAFVFNIRFPFMFDGKATLNNDLPRAGDAFYPRFFGPILSTTIYRSVTGKLIVGFQDRSVTVVNAWLDVAAQPWLHVRVGKVLYPLALERMTLPLRGVFLEHGIASSLLAVSEFGVQLWGAAADKLFEYQLTLGNGAPANQYYETDQDSGKDVLGRVFVRPFARTGNPALAGFGLGFGGSYGVHQGTAAMPLTGVSRTLGGRTFFATRTDAADPTATTVADGRVVRLVPQAAYVVGALVLTGEKAVLLDILSPSRPLDLSAGQLGAFELIGRFETIQFDDELFPIFADPTVSARRATAFGAGLNWIPTDTVRLMINYEHTRFRAAQGAPRLRSENLLGLRLQALF